MKLPFKRDTAAVLRKEQAASRDVNASPSRFRSHDGRLVQVGFSS
jgi:hypothetical protein